MRIVVIIIFGQKMYGKVDRVPGLCYVVTQFAHLNFLPLIPTGGYIIIEGTESGGEFRGKPIGLSLKSVFAGYVRVWLITLICGAISLSNLLGHTGQTPVPPAAVALLVAVAVCGVLPLAVPGKRGGMIQAVAHLSSIILYCLFDGVRGPRVATGQELLLAANVALMVFGLTRLWDHATPVRRRQLMDELGIELPPEDGEEEHVDRWQQWDESEDRRRH
jgi:hypothetical protein